MIDLRKGDCLEILKEIPDKSVDLVVIDPPYKLVGVGAGAFGTKKRIYHQEYIELYKEAIRINENKLKNKKDINFISNGFELDILDELDRVMKKTNIYIWCSKAQIRNILEYYENKKKNIDILTWHKTNPIPTCNNTYLSDTEYCIFAREKGVKLYGTYYTKKKYYISASNKEDKKLYKHPTIKPLEIIKNLIINSSNKNDVVLDCFMGSGTTGVACKELNRNFIGIEIDDTYFEIAKKRIEGD